MSQQGINRVQRVRASRERRAANALLRPSAMHIDTTVVASPQPARVDQGKRPRSLMDFTPELSKLHTQRRCSLRSKMPPMPPAQNSNVANRKASGSSSQTDKDYIQSLKGLYFSNKSKSFYIY